MNLTDQQVTSVDQINLTDALNSSILELEISRNADTVVPATNDLIIYVDTNSKDNPSQNRKQFVFNMSKKLEYYNQVSDEFLLQINILDNDVKMQAIVKRKIEVNDDIYSIANVIDVEEMVGCPINLFSGSNYIYTNYSNAVISLIYPKNNDFNRLYLNNTIYFDHKENSKSDFSLADIYFKDAFTKSSSNLNIEINNANVDSIISNNNKFSLDSDGNLMVNTITTNQNLINTTDIYNLIYPVGSIYMSVNQASPSTLFGGTWEQIKDTFLLAAGDSYNLLATGGEANHTLNINEMPSHAHGIRFKGFTLAPNPAGYFVLRRNEGADSFDGTDDDGAMYAGGNQAHNNMPPYLAVNMWKRTS